MKLNLETEGTIVKHSFFINLKNALEKDTLIEIENAGLSKYVQGWKNYLPFYSDDDKNFTRLAKSTYNEGVFSFTAPKGAKYICWFPNYAPRMFELFLEEHNLELKYEDNVPYLFIGDNSKPAIVVISRQHPGETMSSFFLEGFLKSILEGKDNKYSYIIFPFVNICGVENGNHRLTSDGIDINRMWNKKHPYLNAVKNITENTKIECFLDIHGDEITKNNYAFGAKKNKFAAKIFSKDFIALPIHSYLRKLLRSLIRERKIISPFKGHTAQKYFAKFTKNSFTIELSAHKETPESLIKLGADTAINIEKG